jgi:dihydrodipicolinate synthase/N-acetylneuraminate lyase
MSKMPGVMAVKAALSLQGLVENVVRLPLVSASATQIEQLKIDLVEGGLSL